MNVCQNHLRLITTAKSVAATASKNGLLLKNNTATCIGGIVYGGVTVSLTTKAKFSRSPLLANFNLISGKRLYSIDSKKLDKDLLVYAGYNLNSVTLQQLTDFGRNLNINASVNSTKFVQTELCVRLANIVKVTYIIYA